MNNNNKAKLSRARSAPHFGLLVSKLILLGKQKKKNAFGVLATLVNHVTVKDYVLSRCHWPLDTGNDVRIICLLYNKKIIYAETFLLCIYLHYH